MKIISQNSKFLDVLTEGWEMITVKDYSKCDTRGRLADKYHF